MENNNLIDYGFKSDYHLDLTQSLQLKIGVFGTAYNVKYDYRQNDTVSIIDKNDFGNILGGYFTNTF